eukprot:CAMPEP_0115178148 /NCGR_PEP_ID=MMETSP0270-20121206/5750_1 /TAXON_ID=71861 /ORGANISM="Scrippsiella trochoidea, Strain CCMP3099" /LENGTH=365 /DNA_ID=CAMNT_0002591099 /DNA_START=60 /DNA_END=1157 /DNA_ORIENTATION=+
MTRKFTRTWSALGPASGDTEPQELVRGATVRRTMTRKFTRTWSALGPASGDTEPQELVRGVTIRRNTAGFQKGESIEASRGTVNYKLWGDQDRSKPLVVTIHGLMGSMSTFSIFAKELVGLGYNVLTFDLFGFGLSDMPKHERYDPQFYVSETLELLDLLGYPEDLTFHLVGFSMGGLVAMFLAHHFPERVRRLLLIAPAGLVPLGKMERMGIRALKASRKLGIPVVSMVAKRVAKKEVDAEDFEPDMEESPFSKELAERNAKMFRSDPVKYTKAWMKCVRDMGLAKGAWLYESVAAGPVEVMFIWGDHDCVVPLDDAVDTLRKYFPKAPVAVFKGAGHGILAEHSERAAKMSADWFASSAVGTR